MKDTLWSRISEMVAKYQDHHFTNYIKGKRVVIVGPDTALKNKKLGKYIDGFDIVVRHNTVFDYLPMTTSMKRDYGSRTDILYWSPTCMKNYSKKSGAKNLQKLRQNRVKYLVYQNGNKNNLYLTGEYCFPEALAYFKKHAPKVNVKLHYSHHTARLLTDLLTERSKRPIVPRTGLISIFDMMIHQAGEIKILGMSFYQGGGHAFRPDVKKELDPLADHKGNKSPHDSNVELTLMREFLDEYSNMDLDLKIAKLLVSSTEEEPRLRPQPESSESESDQLDDFESTSTSDLEPEVSKSNADVEEESEGFGRGNYAADPIEYSGESIFDSESFSDSD